MAKKKAKKGGKRKKSRWGASGHTSLRVGYSASVYDPRPAPPPSSGKKKGD